MTELVTHTTIDMIGSYREQALELHGQAYDKTEEARHMSSRACVSLVPPKTDEEAIRRSGVISERYMRESDDAREKHMEKVRVEIDRAIWNHVMIATKMEKLMDAKERSELRNAMYEDPIPATPDNILSTIERLMEESHLIFNRGVANVFSSLDRRFRSHDGFKIGSRIIINRALSEWGGWDSYRQDTIRDIERTFYILDGKENPDYAASFIHQVYEEHREARRVNSFPVYFENEYFRIKAYKNRNVHLWFKRDDLVKKVNRLLADYYGETIGEGPDVATDDEMGPSYHVTPAKNMGFFPTPERVVERLLDFYNYRDVETILEPSAGEGNIADGIRERFPNKKVTCVEMDVGRSAILKSKGYETHTADFLRLEPSDIGTYDAIVMNPPFDMGRDCDHVRHAIKFLKPGGMIISVMSARAELSEMKRCKSLRTYIEKHMMPISSWDRRFWMPLPDGSFKECGTMVNTSILAFYKPK